MSYELFVGLGLNDQSGNSNRACNYVMKHNETPIGDGTQ